MKRFLQVSVLFLIVISLLAGLALAQTQTGKIVVVGVPDRFKSANGNQATYGLKAVGVGSRVVLAAKAINGVGAAYNDSVWLATSAVWTLKNPFNVSKPIQDTAAGLNGKFVYFIPDTVGDWTVTMTATTDKGTAAPVEMKITAAKFLGAGISLNETNVPMGCICHLANPTNFRDWQKTNHATAVKRKTSDPAGHFSFSCMSCHSAGYDGLTTSGNNGFDDMAKAEGFSAISRNGVGVYDTLVMKYPKSMALAGIQCENCHGPASQHVTAYPTPGNTKLDQSLSSEVCAPCHFSSDRHGIGYSLTGSVHSVMSGSNYRDPKTGVYRMLGRATNYDRILCARCHTAQGYINEAIGGNPQPIPTTTTAPVYANGSPMTCATCHDPHNGSNEKQLRAKTVGDVCIGCHITRLSSGGMHSSHQGGMLLGANLPPFTIDNWTKYISAPASTLQQVQAAVGTWGGWEFPGYAYENSSHSDIKERCVTCHMAKSPSYIATEAANFPSSKPDTMMTKLGRHTFAVAYTNISGTDTTTILNPTGCEECHGEVSMEFVELTQAKTRSLLAKLFAALPKRDSAGTSIISLSDTVAYQNWAKAPANLKRRLTIIDKAAAFNYIYVNNDGSYGVHNFNYAKGLVNSSIEQLQLAAGAASITSIKDVPFDNGRKVQVVWNAFPAEQWAFNTVINYGVWRKDPVLPGLSSIKKASNFTEMMKLTSQGSQVIMAGSVWSFVGAVPASGQPQYSYVAPTLFDSTKSSGQKWTVFYIAGYSKDNAVVYSTLPDSGFSTDNISPNAVQYVSAGFTTNEVTLRWKAGSEPDVYEYAIYRGTTASFTPTSPVAKVRIPEYKDKLSQTGTTYYYKVSAIDIAGNESPFASVSVLTGVENSGGVPTEFALGQNYPNPFNPSTEITFAVPKQTNVKLVVYNLAGEVVSTLVNQSMSAGNYRATWNGRADDGRTVASGVYFYHLQAEGFIATKKMTLLK